MSTRENDPYPYPDLDLTQLRASLARAREERGITLEQLAIRSGVGRQTILDIGSGKFKGGIETWIRLARTLEVSLDDLIAPVWTATDRKNS